MRKYNQWLDVKTLLAIEPVQGVRQITFGE